MGVIQVTQLILRKLKCNFTGLCRNASHRTQMIGDEKTGNELTGTEMTGNDMTGNDKSRHRNDGDELTATKRRRPKDVHPRQLSCCLVEFLVFNSDY